MERGLLGLDLPALYLEAEAGDPGLVRGVIDELVNWAEDGRVDECLRGEPGRSSRDMTRSKSRRAFPFLRLVPRMRLKADEPNVSSCASDTNEAMEGEGGDAGLRGPSLSNSLRGRKICRDPCRAAPFHVERFENAEDESGEGEGEEEGNPDIDPPRK